MGGEGEGGSARAAGAAGAAGAGAAGGVFSGGMGALVSGSHSTALLQCGDDTTTEPSSPGPSPPTHRKMGASLPGRQNVSFT